MASTAIAQNRVGMELTLQLISQDIASNTSVVRRRGRVWRNSGTGIWGSGASWSASEAGGGAGGSFGYDFRSTYEYVLMVQDFTVYHNADGTAGITSRFDVNMNNTSYPGGGTVWESMTLPTIPRASTPSWSGNFEAGTAKTINMNRASSSFTHTVQYFFGSASGTIATGVTDSVSWTPPLSLLQQIPNSASGTGTLRVITDGIGTKDVAFTLVAPATAVPTINAPTITEDNSAVATVMGAGGIYVQKLSNIKAVVTGAGYQSSTIAAAEFSIGGVSSPSGGTVTPQTSGTVVLTSKVTDSRGKTATRNDNITVRAYSTPTINSFLVQRATSAGVVANEGTYLRVDLNAVVSSLMNGTEKNTLGIRMFTRLKGATTWTARNVINHTAVTYNNNFLISGAPYAVNQAYDVLIEVFDKFNIAAGQTTIATAAIYMNWAPGGLGLAKYWEAGALDVGGDIYSNNILLSTPLGSITQFAGATAPTGWLLCQGQAVSRTTYADLYALIGDTYGAGNGTSTFNLPNLKGRVAVGLDSAQTEFDTLGEVGGAKTHTLTYRETPVQLGVRMIWGQGNIRFDPAPNALAATPPGNTLGTWQNDVRYDASANNVGNNNPAQGGQPHNNLQPYLVLNYIIKVI